MSHGYHGYQPGVDVYRGLSPRSGAHCPHYCHQTCGGPITEIGRRCPRADCSAPCNPVLIVSIYSLTNLCNYRDCGLGQVILSHVIGPAMKGSNCDCPPLHDPCCMIYLQGCGSHGFTVTTASFGVCGFREKVAKYPVLPYSEDASHRLIAFVHKKRRRTRGVFVLADTCV